MRVGLEDAVYVAKGVLAPSNAALVQKGRRMAEDLGAEIMTAQEARAALKLPPTNGAHAGSAAIR